MNQRLSSLGGMELRHEVQDLGHINENFEGIYSVGYSEEEIRKYIHEVFLEGADRYLSFCPVDRALIEHWKDLIRAAIGKEIEHDGLRIIDIGSGGGTTILPLLELLPQSQVVATDLSLPLLASLRNLARSEKHKSLTILQMNAENIVFADYQADIIMGAHVLHHLLSPANALREVRRVLRPGGTAVFWEGFEDGAQILASLFDLWMEMDRSQATHLSPGVIEAMKGFAADLDRRKGRTKTPEMLAVLDDKWFFTRYSIEDLAAEAGFLRCELNNVYAPQNVVRMMANHELRRWGFGLQELPEWAREKLLSVQARMSDDYLDGHPFSAAIVMRA
jgi:ubiquinone/menaquinone biosynthesis C-methylase UbiE